MNPEELEARLDALAKERDLVPDVLKLVAQSMCFSELQKKDLVGETRQKVEMMLSAEQFAPYEDRVEISF